MATPTHRDTARVLPVSPDGAVLLLRELDPVEPDAPYWSSIGGGRDRGEGLRTTAVRELRKEAGLVAAAGDLLGPVHEATTTWSWGGVEHVGHHTYFALALSRDAPREPLLLEPEEVGTVLGSDWVTPGDLSGGTCRPPDLPDIARLAVAALEEDR